MTGYRLSPAAQADLDNIWNYTAERWDVDQAERYVLAIRAACEALADRRRRGQSVDAIRSGYRKLAVGSHFLFFRVTDRGEIEIIRILHQRMDVRRHLGG